MKFDKEKLGAWQTEAKGITPRQPKDRKEALLLSCLEWHPDNPKRGNGHAEPMCEWEGVGCSGCPIEDVDHCSTSDECDNVYALYKGAYDDEK